MSEVDVTAVGSPTHVQVYVTAQAPTNLVGARLAGETSVSGTHGVIRLSKVATGRYVVVWLTRIPAVSGGFQGGVAEAVIKGE